MSMRERLGTLWNTNGFTSLTNNDFGATMRLTEVHKHPSWRSVTTWAPLLIPADHNRSRRFPIMTIRVEHNVRIDSRALDLWGRTLSLWERTLDTFASDDHSEFIAALETRAAKLEALANTQTGE